MKELKQHRKRLCQVKDPSGAMVLYLLNIRKAAQNLSVIRKFIHYEISLTRVAFSFEISVHNSFSETVRLTWPSILIHHRGKTLAVSVKKKEMIVLESLQELKVETISVAIPYDDLIYRHSDLNNELNETGTVKISVEVHSRIEGWYIYKQIENIFLGGRNECDTLCLEPVIESPGKEK